MNKRLKKHHTLFVIVGIANTAIDFLVLNFVSAFLGVPRVPANVVSVSTAMSFSYFANKQLVFEGKKKSRAQAARFFAVTIISLYVLQTLVILLLTEAWTWPLDTAYDIIDAFSLNISRDFVYTNGSKLAATAFSMVFNYLLYSRYVFHSKDGRV
ncbi:MAG: GtrA family protein [Patescibacteria group bacterium]